MLIITKRETQFNVLGHELVPKWTTKKSQLRLCEKEEVVDDDDRMLLGYKGSR